MKNAVKFILGILTCLSLKVSAEVADNQSPYCKPLDPNFWICGEYLCWRIKDAPVKAPLVTTASFVDPHPGALGQPHTKIIWGDENIRIKRQQGLRLSAGAPLICNISLETAYFLLPKTSQKKSLSTSGEPGSLNFAVPIFDTTGFWGGNGIPGESVFLLPGPLFGDPGFSGRFHLKMTSRLQGAELNTALSLLEKEGFNLDVLGGFRWIQLAESLSFSAKSHTVPDFPFPAGHYNFKDHFKTMNNFYGAQLGLRAQYDKDCWFWSGAVKGGLGIINKRISIHGTSDTLGGNLFYATNGPSLKLAGGVFAQKTNHGPHVDDDFSGIFEATLRGGLNLNSFIKIFVGYDFLWLSNVWRPGSQINRKINPTRTALATASRNTVGTIVGPVPFGEPSGAQVAQGKKEPHAHSKSSRFWAQGITAGVTVAF